MLNIAICDDEKYMSDKIKKLVSGFFARKNIKIKTCQFTNGEELLKYNKNIDILFLDIQMEGTNGMEIAKKLRKHSFNGFLVFITVLAEMVFGAFEVQAYDYLVKPLNEKHFERTMERMLLSMQNSSEKSLLVKKGYENSIISFDNIISVEVIGRKIYLHLVSSEVVDFYGKIGELETKLGKNFFKCHRSFLINLKYLESYRNGTAYMEGGIQVPVSRLRGKEFSDIILQYMKNI